MDKRFKPNPYSVLEVSNGASNTEITKAFTQAMKQRKYPPDQIAKARKILMNKEERILADYLRPNNQLVKRFKAFEIPKQDVDFTWEILPEFDSISEDITDSIAKAYKGKF